MSPNRSLIKTAQKPNINLCEKNFIYRESYAETSAPPYHHVDSHVSQERAIRILIVFGPSLDLEQGPQAQADLVRALGKPYSFSVSYWRITSLRHPRILEMATRIIATADIVLFSLDSGTEISQVFREWLEKNLIGAPDQQASLLVWSETGRTIDSGSSPTQLYLRDLASKAGVDCLCYSEASPLAQRSPNYQAEKDRDNALVRRTRLFRSENSSRVFVFTE